MVSPADQELLDIVDEKDRVIGVRPRSEIHRRQLPHRSVHIFIYNSRGALVLQKRSTQKDQYPEHWDSSAAGHLDPGEKPPAAAHRELREELGIDTDLVEVYRHPACPETGWEFVTLFTGTDDGPVHPNPKEITEVRTFSPTEVETLLKNPKEKVAPGFRLLYEVIRERLPEING